MKASEYRDQSVEELEAALSDLHKDLFSLRNERRLNKKLDHPHELKYKRKDIAKILTVLREKQNQS
ncbi:MAG: 50S ribosomal protein L29 [Chlamydiota bacterium]